MSADLHFTGRDFTAALAALDGVKDSVLAGAVPNEAAGAEIVDTFGLMPRLVYGFAQAYARDVHSHTTEWGGGAHDVATTCVLDGIMIGLGLALHALTDVSEGVSEGVGG